MARRENPQRQQCRERVEEQPKDNVCRALVDPGVGCFCLHEFSLQRETTTWKEDRETSPLVASDYLTYDNLGYRVTGVSVH